MKWICIAGIAIGCLVYLAFPPKAYSQQITIYTGPQGQFLGQATVITPMQPTPIQPLPTQQSPTQPIPPVIWGQNGK